MDKALHIIKEIMNSTLTKDFNCAFPEIVYNLDVGRFQKQECDLGGVDFEYVKFYRVRERSIKTNELLEKQK